ncbi:hypothetical protein AVEN_238655-1 [Araneus ventricosus]|uniref:Uncharacterized protein n=2 Tax=Araneus ventricosus TaxID=182803 RepID=A0A4Y2X645_ARAVE|nr:hypothetical protein AVEN_44471-1 [Araneus ventricosus]GBO45205.1 hypothetical protein AVEN_238655-1 [Araneus ventricosus]
MQCVVQEKGGHIRIGDVKDEDEVLEWLITQLTKDEIEDVTEKMLLYLVDSSPNLAALFYDEEASVSELVLKELENIDDELQEQGIPFVKISDYSLAKQFGLNDELPILVYFENKIPSVYEGESSIVRFYVVVAAAYPNLV